MPTAKVANDHRGRGQDVFVPWVLNEQIGHKQLEEASDVRVYNRFYHMFDEGELRELVCEAAQEVGLFVSPVEHEQRQKGVKYVDIVQDGWEKSNFYIELQLSVG